RVLFNSFEEPIVGFKRDGSKFQVSKDFDLGGFLYKEWFSDGPFEGSIYPSWADMSELSPLMLDRLVLLLGCGDTKTVGRRREYRNGSTDIEDADIDGVEKGDMVHVDTFLIDTLEIDSVIYDHGEGFGDGDEEVYDEVNECDFGEGCPTTFDELERLIDSVGRQNILHVRLTKHSPYSFYANVAYRGEASGTWKRLKLEEAK
ncbi:MAG: hypothetical protein ABJN96_09530, partial [Marinomonas sp.]